MAAGRVALVSGAGRGLGAAIARTLAARGHAVAVNDLAGAPGGPALVAELREAGHVAVWAPGDVTDPAGVAAAVGAARGLGPVTVLVANASGPQPVIAFDELEWADLEHHLAFFARSPLLLARAVVGDMRAAGRGRIVHIGSDLFERAERGWSAYSAAKGAMLGLTRGWAHELARDGITVNLVAPGWIPVERHAGATAAELGAYGAATPVGRPGRPEEVAATVAFLCSDEASYVNGARIAVNGGHTLT